MQRRSPGRGSDLKLAVVTASIDPKKTQPFWRTWREHSVGQWDGVMVVNTAGPVDAGAIAEWKRSGTGRKLDLYTEEVLGVVPAFRRGVEAAMTFMPDVIACLHDDVALFEEAWDRTLVEFFAAAQEQEVGLCAGLSGALAVGQLGMYEREFDPMTLARHGFCSNMRDAESHGERVTTPRRVVYSDGFSLIGPARFVLHAFRAMDDELEIVHHAYDVAFACLAAQAQLEYWLVPIECHHHGGLSATRPEYLEWAREKHGGDGQVWLTAHSAVYESFRGVLPLEVQTWKGKVYGG